MKYPIPNHQLQASPQEKKKKKKKKLLFYLEGICFYLVLPGIINTRYG